MAGNIHDVWLTARMRCADQLFQKPQPKIREEPIGTQIGGSASVPLVPHSA